MTPNEIYSLYSPLKQRLILLSCSLIAILTPFSDTIYLPALETIESKLHTSAQYVSLSVSLYLGFVGLGQLLSGPLGDKYGRWPVLVIFLLFFEGLTISCIFAENILALIVERCLQGFMIGPAVSLVQAIISDVFAPEVRGVAIGAFLGPMLFGPIFAPLLGGILNSNFGWRYN